MIREWSMRSAVHRALKHGMRGEDVKILQRETNQRANAYNVPGHLKVDGEVGPKTLALVDDVAYALGALKSKIDRDEIAGSVQKMIRHPRRRTPGQRLRAARRRTPRIVVPRLSFQNVFGSKGDVYRGAGHYTAGRRAKNKRELVAEMKADHAYHMSKGWGGLSYEAMIADDGTIGLGNPMWRKAAAVALNNTGMVGVCCPGTTGDRMTAAQRRSAKWLLEHWHTTKIPKAHRLPRRAKGLDLRGHKEFPSQSTACPGDMLGQYHAIFKEF